jgi:WD40 repeat protein
MIVTIQDTEKSKAPGLYVATGSRDKVIKLWDTTSGHCLKTLVCVLLVTRKFYTS